ncbi:hypothetical protein PAECIP111893_00776 [Paenibacillus plantiphilus]|uniref:Uncharacterized protein n=1 Tax=Paenibacillus plantiphilus TaxID=2905650 RepID=A0ABN8G4M9_9BACL|nr:hypothetical protein [Paenibacillus plantiphilus]CAH1195903.1 hypothetical protein PAECIP111893_00776 [Paenibacillus plantiphilus]
MDTNRMELVQKLVDAGVLKDPQRLNRLDESVPLWVVLEMMVNMLERIDPPHQPFD